MVLDILTWAFKKYKPFCFLSHIFLIICFIGYPLLIWYWMTRMMRMKKKMEITSVAPKLTYPSDLPTIQKYDKKYTKTRKFPKRNVSKVARKKSRTDIRLSKSYKTQDPLPADDFDLQPPALNRRGGHQKKIRLRDWPSPSEGEVSEIHARPKLPYKPRANLKVEPAPSKFLFKKRKADEEEDFETRFRKRKRVKVKKKVVGNTKEDDDPESDRFIEV